jgi:hypothetical protein
MGFGNFSTIACGIWNAPLAAAITGASLTERLTYTFNKLIASQVYGSENG